MSLEMGIKNRILVVDDDQLIRNMLYSLLTDSGYSVEMAENGKEGFEKIKKSKYDVIVSDVNMPEMNGTALYSAAIRYSPELGKRFFFITSSQEHTILAFFGENKCGYMIKPFKFGEFLENIRSMLTRHQKEREERIDWSAYCQLSTEGSSVEASTELLAKTVDISHHGAKIRYFGKPLAPNTRAHIYLRELDVKRDVTIVWSLTKNESVQSGLISNEEIPSSLSKRGVRGSTQISY